jgi:hypothetical protein
MEQIGFTLAIACLHDAAVVPAESGFLKINNDFAIRPCR